MSVLSRGRGWAILCEVLLDQARDVRLVCKEVALHQRSYGEAYEGGDAAAELEDGGAGGENGSGEEEVGSGGGEPACKEGRHFPDDWRASIQPVSCFNVLQGINKYFGRKSYLLLSCRLHGWNSTRRVIE